GGGGLEHEAGQGLAGTVGAARQALDLAACLALQLSHPVLELDDVPSALLTVGEAAPPFLFELVRHAASEARRAALPAPRDGGDRAGDRQGNGESEDRPAREQPAPFELAEAKPLLEDELIFALHGGQLPLRRSRTRCGRFELI